MENGGFEKDNQRLGRISRVRFFLSFSIIARETTRNSASSKEQKSACNGQRKQCSPTREGEGRKASERSEKPRSDIPARLTHLVPARVLPAPTFQDLFSRARARTRTHTRPCACPRIPAESISLPVTREERPTPSAVLVAPPATALAISSSHRRAIRPPLTHRHSRGLLGARGKMRQVVVRSRRTREIRPLSSPLRRPFVRPSVRPPVLPSSRSLRSLARSLARQRHSFVRAYRGRARARADARACMRRASPPREAGTYFCPRQRGPINGCPRNERFRHD